MTNVTIIGATTWGNSLGRLLAREKVATRVWARTEARAEEMRREQQSRLSDADSPNYLYFTNDVDEALHSAEVVIWAVPAQSLRQNIKRVRDGLKASMILINAAKGLEAETGKRMSEVIEEEVAFVARENIGVLSGPNLSQEIDQGLPATSVVAARNDDVAKEVQGLLDSPSFFVFTSDDVIGVELCGALKNVIALGAGMFDGLSLGNNAKATFITAGWGEIISLGVALGARAPTFYGFAGLGDLLTTCNSALSRNHYVGYELGKGRSLSEITASMSNVAEGVDTIIAVHRLATKPELEMPIIDLIYEVLFESLSPGEISTQFKDRIISGIVN